MTSTTVASETTTIHQNITSTTNSTFVLNSTTPASDDKNLGDKDYGYPGITIDPTTTTTNITKPSLNITSTTNSTSKGYGDTGKIKDVLLATTTTKPDQNITNTKISNSTSQGYGQSDEKNFDYKGYVPYGGSYGGYGVAMNRSNLSYN